ncbi:hypothetical protein [Arvimicrobium flavum]|uniref:hypothetical protein n=1 Tax=Arvimicrobium flavum TaxID=3393320 RepID=UPI00237B378E|nr:hypothetical protein [Mesorhizobium shangrilense]
MINIALALYGIVVLGLLAMAVKFGLGPVPAPHHAAAMSQDGVSLTPKLRMVLKGVYQSMAGAYVALAIVIAWTAYGSIRIGHVWPAWALAVAGLCCGLPAAFRSRQVQLATGVRSPWLAAVTMTALMVVAAVVMSLR